MRSPGASFSAARDRERRLAIGEFDQPHAGLAAHGGQMGEHVGHVGDDRLGAEIAEHESAGAAAAADEPLALEFGERAAHGDARDAVLGGQRLLARQRAAVAQPAAGDAVAQQQIELSRFGSLDAGHPACL